MKKAIRNIFMILLAAAAAISCDKALLADNGYELDGDYRIVVSGSVSALEGNAPLEEIKVTFNAYPVEVLYPLPIFSTTVYTDNKGLYSFDAKGFSSPITCSITAESQEGSYSSSTQEIKISWTGPSFDMEHKTFFVNNCDFKLSKPGQHE